MKLGHDNRRLVFLVTEDWFFATHFLPLARAARDAGFDVLVVTNLGDRAEELRREGFRLISLAADRLSLGPRSLVSTIFRIRSILLDEHPDVIHAIALKSVILGGIANSLGAARPGVYSLTGLGYLWSGNRLVLKTARAVVRLVLSLLPIRSSAVFTFENHDDASEFPNLRPKVVIGGWGIDVNALRAKTVNHAKMSVTALYFGRMLRAKGIEQAVQAVQIARRYENITLELWGNPDPGNPTSLSVDELHELSRCEGVTWNGRASDAAMTWQRADIAILLSEREGMPRSLIEASATGLPIVAYDVPGCRSIVQDGENGFLAPAGNVEAVAAALVKLARNSRLREQMGSVSRSAFEQNFSTESVVPRITGIYLDLVRVPDMR